MNQVRGIFWNGGAKLVKGRFVRETASGIIISDTSPIFIPWRYVLDDLFIPPHWAPKIDADRRGWSVGYIDPWC